MDLISSKPREKRKHSSSSDENVKKEQKISSGLTSVLSDLRFSNCHNISSDLKSGSDDSVFFKSPTKINVSKMETHEKLLSDSSLLNPSYQQRLHSSLLEDRGKKNVNFHLETHSSPSYVSLRGFSDCSSIASHAAHHRSERFGSDHSNMLLCTPDNSKQNLVNIHSVSNFRFINLKWNIFRLQCLFC